MKNIIKHGCIVPILLLIVFGCKKESKDLSRITYYADLKLEGGIVVFPIGGTYEEPGYTATENGVDISEKTKISNDINADSIAVYTVTYELENTDGYPSKATRTVIVNDPNAPDTDFSGTYKTNITRTERDGSDPRSYEGKINITKMANGIFYVDCLLGTIYSVSFDYGSAYAMTGYISLQNDNSIEAIYSHVFGWSRGLEGFKEGIYAPSTKLPTWTSVFANGDNYKIITSHIEK